jgi:glutamyl-tRNA reductase
VKGQIQVTMLGVSHRDTPLAVRERLGFSRTHLPQALEELRAHVPEGVILSTCHRVELYAAGDAPLHQELRNFWMEQRGVPPEVLEEHGYVLSGRDAVTHLLRVACGLDSAVIGEPQILGQVRAALQLALDHGSTGPVLSALFRQAIRTGKRARTETGVARSAISVSYAAVELARRCLGDLSGKRALLVGAGKMGELAAKHLRDHGVRSIAVSSRTIERAQELAAASPGAVAVKRLEDALKDADIVISCSGAPEWIIGPETVARAMGSRCGDTLLMVDIAVPRDVDPSVASIPGVRLYNIADLEPVLAVNLGRRMAEVPKAEAIVDGEADEFEAWLGIRRVTPVIRALHRRAEEVRREELARTAAVLDRLPEDDRRRIEALTLAVQKKLLHPCIALLRAGTASGDGDETAEAVRQLFGLRDPSHEAERAG